ncbi:hypothetical protein [Microbacterium sp. G2-8]|uniref:hypothetical protein n=1 Tax=Microbacterium sp. G2-8 TaxID=2842454 RepID=UPI001C89F2E3|nr:hypothetical protein [Microbacterium sp. G2-8]
MTLSADDGLSYAARFAERVAQGTGLRLAPTNPQRLFTLSDLEVRFAVVPVEGGFELHHSDRSSLRPVAFATRLDDVLRLLAARLFRSHGVSLSRDDLPSSMCFEQTPKDVSVTWSDAEARACVVRVWGLALREELAVRVALWVETDLDEIADQVQSSR